MVALDLFSLPVCTNRIQVKVLSGKKGSHLAISSTPFGVGLAADAMTIRRGGKQLPMEDVSLCEWPLRGFQEVCPYLTTNPAFHSL